MSNIDSLERKPDDEIKMREQAFHYFEQTVVNKVHHFYLNEKILDPKLYTEMIFRIQTASPNDVVYIHLNTPGGYINTGVQLVNSMKSSPAHVVCSLEGEVASLGTMIFLGADEFIVHDYSMMMIHNYSGGVFGKGHEQIAALDANTKWISGFMKDLYVPFMSEDEFKRLQKGEDLYFQAPEIRKRISKMVRAAEKERKSQNKPA